MYVSNSDGILGIHTHNDSELAVANTTGCRGAGITHVQGCINGYGERCGNANLCSILANLELKLGHTTIGRDNLQHLTSVARFVAELANLPLRRRSGVRRQHALCAQGRHPRQRSVEGTLLLTSTSSLNSSAIASGCC